MNKFTEETVFATYTVQVVDGQELDTTVVLKPRPPFCVEGAKRKDFDRELSALIERFQI